MTDWKKDCVEKLRRYDAMCQATENLLLEMERCKLARQKSNLRQLQKERKCAILWCQQVEKALQALTPEENLVLSRLYIYPRRGNIDRLCQELGVEQSSVYRRRDKALGKFCVAIYGAK